MLTDATLPQHKLSPIDVARGGYTRFVLHWNILMISWLEKHFFMVISSYYWC